MIFPEYIAHFSINYIFSYVSLYFSNLFFASSTMYELSDKGIFWVPSIIVCTKKQKFEGAMQVKLRYYIKLLDL